MTSDAPTLRCASPEPDGSLDVRDRTQEAVRWVAEALYQRHAQAPALRGARGRQHTEQDIAYHVEFLAAALTTAAPVFFTDYVRWLATVLESRGVPVQMLNESLELLTEFYREALPPAAAGPVMDLLDQGRQVLLQERVAGEPVYGTHRPQELPEAEALARALIAGDVQHARRLCDERWRTSGSYVQLATGLFQPALYDIGTAWQRNQITVAQEHLATSISQTLLTGLYLQSLRNAPSERRGVALFAGVEGNHHVLGLRMVADAFELGGWSVQALGANTPTDALVEQIDRVRPDLVGLSASMVQQLPTLQRAVACMRAELGSRCPLVLVGGLPTNQFEPAWRWVGADAWAADAARALAEVA
jgi:MerR family transcriptional regulator, light-induced transcriptional regulator